MKLAIKDLKFSELAVQETLFHNANGYLGVRGCLEEGTPEGAQSIRGCYINGFYDTVDLKYPEALYGFPSSAQRMVNLPDVQTVKLRVNGTEFSIKNGTVQEYSRELDTKEGITKRSFQWNSLNGDVCNVQIRRLASFVQKELFILEYNVTAISGELQLELTSSIDADVKNFSDPNDPRVASEEDKHLKIDCLKCSETGGTVACSAIGSGLETAVAVGHTTVPQTGFKVRSDESKIWVTASAKLAAGETLTLTKYCVFADSRREANPSETANRVLKLAMEKKAAYYFEEQKNYLNAFQINTSSEIIGNARDNDALEYNLFELLQSTGTDGIGNVSAKGLSGEGYEGHYFWDTEIYLFPFYLHTQPSIARAMLEFRYRILGKARTHAVLLGHKKGALYPWRTISGSECSGYFPSGSAQYHINGDVAHSFMQYWYFTGDLGFMAEKGAEVLLETARLWLDVGHYNQDHEFCIDCVTGPDEYTCLVNNNYYTNRCAQANLCGAVEICEALENAGYADVLKKLGVSKEELHEMRSAADAMRLPYDAEQDINPQDDSFFNKKRWDFASTPKENYPLLLHYHPLCLYRHQVCKQADTVLAHFLYGEGVKQSTIKNSLRYYEKITTHDSSLSKCIFGIMYARTGDVEKAYQCFEDTVNTDLCNSHGNTKDGIHTANMGGAYLMLVYGFAGLQMMDHQLTFAPVLPSQWQGYSFAIRFRGSQIKVLVKKKTVSFSLCEGKPITLKVNGRDIMVQHRTEVTLHET